MKVAFALAFAVLLLALTAGCKPRERGVDWDCESLSFSNQVVELYWSASTWVDSADFGHRLAGRVTKHRTGDYYFVSTLDLKALNRVERFISKPEFERISRLKQECIRQFSAERISDDAKVLDANCDGNFIVLRPDLESMPMIIGGGATNRLPALRSLSLIKCAINERGDFFSMSLFAGIDRKSKPGVPFQILRDGKWWVSHIPGKMPLVSDTNLVRTSSFPALVETSLH